VSNGERLKIADDPDWSADGQHIAFTAHDAGDEGPNWPLPPFISNSTEIYVLDAPFTGTPRRLTENNYEERAPAWSPDGSQIVFSCRTGGGTTRFHICVKNADASPTEPPQQLTFGAFGDLTATWSPDGSKILFHRNKPIPMGGPQLWVMNADGTDQTQLTCSPQETCAAPIGGFNLLAHWGQLRVHLNP
jgi:TolB protein